MPVLEVTPELLRRGKTALDEAFGTPMAAEVNYGPPQPPLDELPGATITPEMVGDLGLDPFGRDDFSIDQKVQAARYINAAYEANRHRPIPPPFTTFFGPGLYVLSGDVGDGKTLVAVSLAVEWMIHGWPAYSANGGLAFGKALEPAQVYAFPDYVTKGAIVVADELHSIYGRSEGMSVRGRTMAQGTAAFRKEEIYAFGCTAREWMLGGDLKAAVRGLGYPKAAVPKGKLYAPPWAYRQVQWHYPDPWRGKQFREQREPDREYREPCREWTMGLHPYSVYRAARHYNSWEKIELDYGGDLDAGKFRSQAFGKGAKANAKPQLSDEAVGLTILDWFVQGDFDGAIRAYNDALETGGRTDRGGTLVSFRDLSERFQAQGDEVGAAKMRRGLEGLGISASTRAVNIVDLAEGWERYGQSRLGDVE